MKKPGNGWGWWSHNNANMLPSRVGLPVAQQAETLGRWGGSKQRRDSEQTSDPPPGRQGARGIYGMKDKQAGRSERGERGERWLEKGGSSPFWAVNRLQVSARGKMQELSTTWGWSFLPCDVKRSRPGRSRMPSWRVGPVLTSSAQTRRSWLQVPGKQLWQTSHRLEQ